MTAITRAFACDKILPWLTGPKMGWPWASKSESPAALDLQLHRRTDRIAINIGSMRLKEQMAAIDAGWLGLN